MSRRSKETSFNVASCINDIVDHIDFSTCSYTHITQIKFNEIDLRNTPGLPKEEFSRVLRDIADLLETSRISILDSKRPKDRRARFWCATLRKQLLVRVDLPIRRRITTYADLGEAICTDLGEVKECKDLGIVTRGDYDQRLREWCLLLASFTMVDPPYEVLSRSWEWFLTACLFLHHYLYCIAPKSCLSEAKKALELANMLVDKYGEAMMCRLTVVCNLPRAILRMQPS